MKWRLFSEYLSCFLTNGIICQCRFFFFFYCSSTSIKRHRPNRKVKFKSQLYWMGMSVLLLFYHINQELSYLISDSQVITQTCSVFLVCFSVWKLNQTSLIPPRGFIRDGAEISMFRNGKHSEQQEILMECAWRAPEQTEKKKNFFSTLATEGHVHRDKLYLQLAKKI